jgi:hypothetical protein
MVKSCPSCAETFEFRDVCPHCGTLLVARSSTDTERTGAVGSGTPHTALPSDPTETYPHLEEDTVEDDTVIDQPAGGWTGHAPHSTRSGYGDVSTTHVPFRHYPDAQPVPPKTALQSARGNTHDAHGLQGSPAPADTRRPGRSFLAPTLIAAGVLAVVVIVLASLLTTLGLFKPRVVAAEPV